jgi:hypothetical protein
MWKTRICNKNEIFNGINFMHAIGLLWLNEVENEIGEEKKWILDDILRKNYFGKVISFEQNHFWSNEIRAKHKAGVFRTLIKRSVPEHNRQSFLANKNLNV